MVKGSVHSIETFGSVDGPGIRFVIFLRGCMMRCRYCHNVDTWSDKRTDLRSADELLDQAERYRPYWGGEGGITVSGGEPLLQIDFLTELFQKAKQRGINTCLDTAGQPFTSEEPFFGKCRKLMEYTDLVMLDIKHIDPVRHTWLTGWDNTSILDFARYLSEIGKPMWIRQVLVPTVNDDKRSLQRTHAFIDSLGAAVRKVEVLPYHTMGVAKWEALGIPYTLKGIDPPDDTSLALAKRILEKPWKPQARIA